MANSNTSQISTAIEYLQKYVDKLDEITRKNKPINLASHYYQEYDAFVNELNYLFELYGNYDANLQERLDAIDIRPKDAVKLNDAYKDLAQLAKSLSAQIYSNFEFKIKDNMDVLGLKTTRKYLSLLKNKIVEAEDLQDKYESLEIELAKERSKFLELDRKATNINAEKLTLEKHLEQSTEATNILKNENDDLKKGNSVISTEAMSLKTELAHYKEASQKTEVARNSTTFQVQAEGNKKIAYRWMYAIIIAGCAFTAFLWHIFSSDAELFSVATGIIAKSTDALGKISESKKSIEAIDPALLKQLILVEIAKKIGSKILIISLLTYVMTFLVKNYNAQMHNYIVNSHKANALKSTVDLIGTAKGDDGNDKIVLQATQAIFTTQKSGYQGAESEPTSPNLITNVIDAVSGGKKS